MMIFARTKLTYLACIALLVSCTPSTSKQEGQSEAAKETTLAATSPPSPTNVTTRIALAIQKHDRSVSEPEPSHRAESVDQKPTAFSSAPCAEQLWAIIQENPADPAIVPAINWLLANNRTGENHVLLIEFLSTDFFESEHIAQVLPVLIHGYPDKPSLELVQRLSQHSPHKRVKTVATMASVKAQQTMVRFVDFLNNPKWTERMKTFIDAPTLQYYQSAADRKFDFESTLQQLIDQSGELNFGPSIVGQPAEPIHQMARDMLFSIQHLQVGKPAPNITGDDLDGVTFSLNDYRGKIVLLDFWGDW